MMKLHHNERKLYHLEVRKVYNKQHKSVEYYILLTKIYVFKQIKLRDLFYSFNRNNTIEKKNILTFFQLVITN